MEFFSLVIIALCMWGCYSFAERQGRNTTLALVWGFLFSWIALIVYALIGPKKTETPIE